MAKAAFLYLLVALPSARAGESCTKEQYAAKFGAPYTLHALGDAQPPAIEGGAHVVLDVSYSTPCKGGGSSFQGTLVDKFGSSVLIVARDEPECGAEGEALFASEWRGLVAVRLPENFTAAAPEEDLGEPSFLEKATKPDDWDDEEDGAWEPLVVERKSSKKEKSAARFIAFPPDGDFELYTLSERGYSTVEATASAAFSEAAAATTRTEEEQAEVAEELATQSLQDSRNFIAHCEGKIAAGEELPTEGCCSPYMLQQLRLKVEREEGEAAAAAAAAVASEASAGTANESLSKEDPVAPAAPTRRRNLLQRLFARK